MAIHFLCRSEWSILFHFNRIKKLLPRHIATGQLAIAAIAPRRKWNCVWYDRGADAVVTEVLEEMMRCSWGTWGNDAVLYEGLEEMRRCYPRDLRRWCGASEELEETMRCYLMAWRDDAVQLRAFRLSGSLWRSWTRMEGDKQHGWTLWLRHLVEFFLG